MYNPDDKKNIDNINNDDLLEEESLDGNSNNVKHTVTRNGKVIVEEYTIIEENKDKDKDRVDVDKIKSDLKNALSQEELDDPNSEFNINFYNNLAKDSDLFPEMEFDDLDLEDNALENTLDLEDVPQLVN